MVFEETEDGKYINLTTSWLSDKYWMLNRELFEGKLDDCDFGIFTSGRGSQGRVLGLFKMQTKDLKCDRRTRRMFLETYFDKIYVNRDNFVELCNPKIELNGNYKWTEKSALSTLLHEMCHYYIYMNGLAPRESHGNEFRNMAFTVSSKSNNTFPVERIASAEEMKEVELDSKISRTNDKRENTRVSNVVPMFLFYNNGVIGMVPAINQKASEQIKDTLDYVSKSLEKIVVADSDELKEYVAKHYGLSRAYRGYFRIESGSKIDDLFQESKKKVIFNRNGFANENKNGKLFMENMYKEMKININEVLDRMEKTNKS